MKKMFAENLSLKLISVLIAFFLWILILYTYDPAATADFTLNVEILNEKAITSLGKVYEVIEGDAVTIRVKGNASLVKTLRGADFKATADISKLSPTLNANIDVVCTKANNLDIRLIGKVKFLQVKLEELTEKQFPVVVEKRGKPEEGFFFGDAIPKPNLITVSGGESSVNKIATVKVKVDGNEARHSFTADEVPRAYDIDGNEITTGSLKFSADPVRVSFHIYKTKQVALEVKAEGKPYPGYTVESLNFEPKTVTVAGEDKQLKNMSKIIVPIHVEGEITDVEKTVKLSDFIPSGVYPVKPDTALNINCKIVRLLSRDIVIPSEKIELKNKSEKFNYAFADDNVTRLVIKGLQQDLDQVTTEVLKPYIDLKEISEAGEYSLEVKFQNIKGVIFGSLSHARLILTEKRKEEPDTPTDGAIEPKPEKPEEEGTKEEAPPSEEEDVTENNKEEEAKEQKPDAE